MGPLISCFIPLQIRHAQAFGQDIPKLLRICMRFSCKALFFEYIFAADF